MRIYLDGQKVLVRWTSGVHPWMILFAGGCHGCRPAEHAGSVEVDTRSLLGAFGTAVQALSTRFHAGGTEAGIRFASTGVVLDCRYDEEVLTEKLIGTGLTSDDVLLLPAEPEAAQRTPALISG